MVMEVARKREKVDSIPTEGVMHVDTNKTTE